MQESKDKKVSLDLDDIKSRIEKHDDKVVDLLRDQDLYTVVWPHGENVLHWAAAANNLVVAKYAITKLHVNLDNYRGATPLYYGAMCNSIDVCKLLLENGAIARIRSAFSGQFPYEIAKDSALKALLAPNVEKNMFVNYYYRVYMYWRMNLNWFLTPYKHNIQGMVVEPEAESLFKQKGIAAVAEKCQAHLDMYRKASTLDAKQCLTCHSIENVKRCSKCKQVYFCNKKCQKDAHIFHKFDCAP